MESKGNEKRERRAMEREGLPGKEARVAQTQASRSKKHRNGQPERMHTKADKEVPVQYIRTAYFSTEKLNHTTHLTAPPVLSYADR